MADTTDETTAQALRLFNQFLARQADKEKAEKALAKLERAKNDAAAVVRSLQDDPKATAEQRSEAEAAYRAAVERLTAARTDPTGTSPPPADTGEAGEDADEAGNAPADAEEPSAEEPEPDADAPDAEAT